MKVEIWSDVVCPWCYVGKRRFERALEQFPHPVQVTWKSFQLDPSATTTPAGHHAAHLAEKYGRTLEQAQEMLDSMTATAAAEGLELHFDQARSGNTFDAHRLLHLAAKAGLQDELKERLVKAYFTDGEPIDDPAALVRLAAEVGIDATEVIGTDQFADDVRADIAEARELGITGVPFFVIDRRLGVSGAQSTEVLVGALQKAWDSRATLTTVRGGDACEDDSCAV
jgi:predicted DsbA family dithiol-disulfide isomerase